MIYLLKPNQLIRLGPELVNENIDFVLDKESDEFGDIHNTYGVRETSKVHADILEYCKKALETFERAIDLFSGVKIVFVNRIGGGALGRFRSETSTSKPIVMLSEKEMIKAAREYELPLWVVVETTIFHELGHAICELERDMFFYEYLEYGNEEDWVEDFAYELHNYGTIPQDLENFIEAMRRTE